MFLLHLSSRHITRGAKWSIRKRTILTKQKIITPPANFLNYKQKHKHRSKTHLQLKYTFQSHAFRKIIVIRLNMNKKKDLFLLLKFFTYIVRQQKTKSPKVIALTLVKYRLYKKKIPHMGGTESLNMSRS